LSNGWQVAQDTVSSPERAVWWYKIEPNFAFCSSTVSFDGIGQTGSFANFSAIPLLALSFLRSDFIQFAITSFSAFEMFDDQ